ncbi:Alpha-lactalbumin Lactose synthase B protein [Triplophysa tibetana]|uniref:Alpha-lactalbumin Lactose synthase B protein n=1 Tax=Triplophysa tibetana TaxID=1572043 RepID=A0A5A9PJ10_9TELE|nr:Alpha-lactalbumin Lactose synthase B protein [Triplophysa tibetana]
MLKMLGVLALVLLVSGMNEGRIVSKCDLKAQLDAAFGANMTGNMTQGTPANMTGNMTQGTPANTTGNATQGTPANMTRNLTQSVPRNMTGNMTGELIARLVCAVERTSRFNTSLVTTIQLPTPTQNSPKPNGPHQKPREKPDRPHQKPGERPGDSHEERQGGRPGDSHEERQGGRPGDSHEERQGGRPGDSHEERQGGRPGDSHEERQGGRPGDSHEERPGGKRGDSHDGRQGRKSRGKRSPPRAPGRGLDRPPAGSSGISPGTTMNLYGIFQLSDRVACDSGSNQTMNICRMNCNALIDDDIRDDIACLKTLIGFMSNVYQEYRKMESVLPLKMLGVLALVLLVPSMSEGLILSKCDLKAQLEAAEFAVVPDNMTVEDLIAKLVCRASTSGFNTHLVKFITRKHDDPAPEQDSPQASFQAPALASPPPQVPFNSSIQRQAPTLGQPPIQSQNKPQGPPRGQRSVQSQNQPRGPPRGQRPVQSQNQPQAPPQGPPKGPPGKDRKPPAVWHQYGVFQLNDKLACDSEVVPTLNLCQMNCSGEFKCDDIGFDITINLQIIQDLLHL